ncbi:MAG: Tol biopolymer transport system component [Paracoccaceae bacterium]|jgi:Tol biopolymer transport system component
MNAILRISAFLFLLASVGIACPVVTTLSPVLPPAANAPTIYLSHNGNRIIYKSNHGDHRDHAIYSVPINGGLRTQLSLAGEQVSSFRVSPNSDYVIYSAIPFLGHFLRLYRVSTTGQDRLDISGPMVAGSGGVSEYRFIDNSSRVAFIASKDNPDKRELYSVALAGLGFGPKLNGFLLPGENVGSFGESKDGSRILYSTSGGDEGPELFATPPGGGLRVRISSPLPEEDFITAWDTSISGKVVYRAAIGGQLYLGSLAGIPPIHLNSNDLRVHFEITHQEDAVIVRGEGGFYRIDFATPEVRTEIIPPRDALVTSFRLTDDGQFIILESAEPHPLGASVEVVRMDIDGMNPIILSPSFTIEDGRFINFPRLNFRLSADGRGVTYNFRDDTEAAYPNLYYTDFFTGATEIITSGIPWNDYPSLMPLNTERFIFRADQGEGLPNLYTYRFSEDDGPVYDRIKLNHDLPVDDYVRRFFVHPDGYRVVYLVASLDGYQLFASHARAEWEGGTGVFSDRNGWDIDKIPDEVAEVVIDQPGTVSLHSDREIAELRVGGTSELLASLNLRSEVRLTTRFGADIDSNGMLSGSGTLSGGGRAIDIDPDGIVMCLSGDILALDDGIVRNDGLIFANGSDLSQATISFSDTVTNSDDSGSIIGRLAQLFFQGGLENKGTFGVQLGASEIFGDINNTGELIVSDGGAATFHNDVLNEGIIRVELDGDQVSTAVFHGNFLGNGITGAGHVFLEGETHPGFSPGLMEFGGDLSQGPDSTLHMEIGGTTAGSEFDQLSVAGHLQFGGQLRVTLIDDFEPQAGDTFDLWNTGSHDGSFASVILPNLSEGLFWITSSLVTTGELSVSSTPASYLRYSISYRFEGSPDDDDDGDGLSNLLEYALGLNPTEASVADFLISRPEGVDQFTFSLPQQGGEDLILRLQTSGNLVAWETRATRNSGSDTWQSVLPAVLAVKFTGAPGRKEITLRTFPYEETSPRFFRLSITLDD